MCIAPLSLRPERSRAKKALLPFGGLPLQRQSLSRDRESLPFMCLSVSGRLRLRRSSSKGLSPDSSYRDAAMIHEIARATRQHGPVSAAWYWYLCTVMLTRHTAWGNKRLDANIKTAVGVQPLIPPGCAHWAEVHHRAGCTTSPHEEQIRWLWRGGVGRRENSTAQHHGAEVLAARLLRRPAELDQLRDDDVAMVTLDFNDALAHRPSGPTALLEPGGQGFHIGQGHGQAGDRRHSLAGPALGLPAHSHGPRLGGARGALRAYAVPHRPAAIGT
jgi:hypothetical protein